LRNRKIWHQITCHISINKYYGLAGAENFGSSGDQANGQFIFKYLLTEIIVGLSEFDRITWRHASFGIWLIMNGEQLPASA
jgi:hypothetical protein